MSPATLEKNGEQEFRIWIPFRKFDEETHTVSGYASRVDTPDEQGDWMTMAALEAAIPAFMEFGNVREMHTASAVGVVKSWKLDAIGWWVDVEIVDPLAWEKIKKGVYKGFSIAGKKLLQFGKIIATKIVELSTVDRPAHKGCTFDDMMKADGLSKCLKCDSIMSKAGAFIHDCETQGGGMISESMAKVLGSFKAMQKTVQPENMKKGLYTAGTLVRALYDLSVVATDIKYEEAAEGQTGQTAAASSALANVGALAVNYLIEQLQEDLANLSYGVQADEAMAMSKAEYETFEKSLAGLAGKNLPSAVMSKVDGLVASMKKAEEAPKEEKPKEKPMEKSIAPEPKPAVVPETPPVEKPMAKDGATPPAPAPVVEAPKDGNWESMNKSLTEQSAQMVDMKKSLDALAPKAQAWDDMLKSLGDKPLASQLEDMRKDITGQKAAHDELVVKTTVPAKFHAAERGKDPKGFEEFMKGLPQDRAESMKKFQDSIEAMTPDQRVMASIALSRSMPTKAGA